MKRLLLLLFAFTIVSTGAFDVSPAAAQDGIAGTWKLATTSAEESQRKAAIEEAAQELPAFARSRAKKKLDGRTIPPSELHIVVSGDRVELNRAGQKLSLTVGGPAAQVEFEGRRGSAKATRKNGNLVVSLQGDNGERTTIYRLSEDGQRLVLDVEFDVQRLYTPVRYRVTYKRAEV